jgi:hypothetical protein
VSSFLASLPHQLPFRAASSSELTGDQQATGRYFVTAGDALAEGEAISTFMLFEAMAQIGGSIAFRESHEPAFLSAIEGAELDSPLIVGDEIVIEVTLDATFGAVHRFSAKGRRDGVEIARARFYLSSQNLKPL